MHDYAGQISDSSNARGLSGRQWIILALFAATVALLGGASRYDALQIVPLRTLSALFLIPALISLSRAKVKRELELVGGFAVLSLLMLIQLIPLPPQVWQSLPMRGVVAQMDAILGYGEIWRPLTLAPMRTWNAFGSLVVPGTGLLLAIALGAKSRSLLQLMAAIGLLNAALGVLQVVSGPSSPLYLYELTNRGSAVGLFANENHSGIFAACSLLIVARLGIDARRERQKAVWPIVYAAAFSLIFFGALIGGSRAGFSASLGALLVSIFLFLKSPPRKSAEIRTGGNAWARPKFGKLPSLLPLLALGLTAGAFVALGRSPAFQDILSVNSIDDMRWKIIPVALDMLERFWIVGAGFGSFEQTYKMFEPPALLMPLYVNQAHNDWLQFLIEGGIFAGTLLLGLIVWAIHVLVRLFRDKATWTFAIFWLSLFFVIAAASAIDYPLRTPLFQLVFVWLLLALSGDASDAKDTT